MDAAWKVYVGDRRFDDNQISNCFLKMKYETVGRFTFDFRAIDGDESYMVPGNTLRIFWGDLHKMDGVIQRADWDSKQFCYHVYGADIRGFLLDRVNTEPATVSSYTSDVTSQVMFTGCDFPTNIWTGAGESIGKYTFHYKVGIQNTVRVLGATQTRWNTVIERGTVYDHVNGCLYDATKNWEPNALRGATLRFVSGACKNNVYNICGNSSTKVCIRMATENCSQFATEEGSSTGYESHETQIIDGYRYRQILEDTGFESCRVSDYFDSVGVTPSWSSALGGWEFVPSGVLATENPDATSMLMHASTSSDIDDIYMQSYDNNPLQKIGSRWYWGDYGNTWAGIWQAYIEMDSGDITLTSDTHEGNCALLCTSTMVKGTYDLPGARQIMIEAATPPRIKTGDRWYVQGWMKYDGTPWTDRLGTHYTGVCKFQISMHSSVGGLENILTATTSEVDTWVEFSTTMLIKNYFDIEEYYDYWHRFTVSPQKGVSVDNVTLWCLDWLEETGGGTVQGTVPVCSRIGDIYEIVFASMERIEPATLAPATLEKDNHIIRYDRVNNLTDHVTSMTVRGT